MSIQIWKDFDTWGGGALLEANGNGLVAGVDRRRQGDALPQGDFDFIHSRFKCPACLSGSLSSRPSFNRLDDSRHLNMAYVCASCSKGYLICHKTILGTEQPVSIYHWDMPSED